MDRWLRPDPDSCAFRALWEYGRGCVPIRHDGAGAWRESPTWDRGTGLPPALLPERRALWVRSGSILLGPPQVWHRERLLSFATRKTLAVLAYLARMGGIHQREYLAELLWPRNDIQDARGNLRTAIAHLRRSLGTAEDVLTVTRETVALSPSAPITLDVQLLLQARHLSRTVEPGPRLRAELERAVGAYRGPFLDGVSVPDTPEFEVWVAGQRVRWRGAVSELLDRLAELQADDGNLETAIGTLERWVALDPGEERAWQRLVAAYLERGDGAGAR